MATKISFDEVVNAIQNASIPPEEADAIIKDIQQRIQEIEEEKEAKKANAADKPKMQMVGIMEEELIPKMSAICLISLGFLLQDRMEMYSHWSTN